MAYIEPPYENHKILQFKDLSINNLVRLGAYRCKDSKYKLNMHTHEEILEICYIESGFQTYIVQNQKIHLKGGDAIVFFPNEQHGSGGFFQGKGITYWLQINMTLIDGYFLSYHKEDAEIFLKNLLGISKRYFPVHADFKKLLDNLFLVGSENQSPLQKIKIYTLASQILLHILEAASSGLQENISQEILDSVAYIEKNIEQTISMEELSEFIHLSLSHFKTKFKTEMGTSPADFVQRQKIEKSKELLLDPKMTITDVAYALSYSSSQHFSTAFKKYTGKSPTEFKIAI